MSSSYGMQNYSSQGTAQSSLAGRGSLQSDYQPTPSFRTTFLNNLTDTRDGLGINMERPKFPQYAVQTTRIASFKNWPAYLNQTPELLAEAGFVYGGVADSVRCFFCGGGLRNWDPEDNPWEEHARWYPKCGHVRLCKGDDFIRRINEEDAEDEEVLNVPDLAVAQAASVKPQAATVDNIMNSVPVLSVLEWEKDEDKVKRAVQMLQNQGKKDFVARDLMEVLVSMEEAMDTTPDPPNTTLQFESSPAPQPPAPAQQLKVPEPQIPIPEPSVTAVQCSNFEPEIALAEKNIEESEELLEENRRLQEQHLCKICLDERACIVFLPCGHMVSCPQCAPAMRKCPICRTNIKGTVKAYMA